MGSHWSRIYLAGPFFNPVQVEHMERLEAAANLHNLSVYRPRIDGGLLDNSGSREDLVASAEECYQMDLAALEECDLMVALLPYLLHNRTLCTVYYEEASQVVEDTGLVLPDTGTVWEVGYFSALEKPVVGFYPTHQDQLNIMLTQSMVGVVGGHCAMNMWMENGCLLDSEHISSWKGAME